MAKDLPYFKFYCSEWTDGDITLESYEAQGVFINICSYYWSNECKVEHKKLIKKFRGFESIIENLINESIFKLNKDKTISISFLDEQQKERDNKVKGGKASAQLRKTKKQQNVNRPLTDSQQNVNRTSTDPSAEVQLLREEKRREEEKRKDNVINNKKVDLIIKTFNETDFNRTVETLKTSKDEIRKRLHEFLEIECLTPTFENKQIGEIIKHFRNWLNYNKPLEIVKKNNPAPWTLTR